MDGRAEESIEPEEEPARARSSTAAEESGTAPETDGAAPKDKAAAKSEPVRTTAARRSPPPRAAVTARRGTGSGSDRSRNKGGTRTKVASAGTGPARSGAWGAGESRKERDRQRVRAVDRRARTRARRRRGPMARWSTPLIVLGVVGLLVALILLVIEPALDNRIRREAEANINVMVAQQLPDARGVRSSVEGSHLAWNAATSGRIERVKVHADSATYQGMQVQNINGQVDDIRLDPAEARNQKVKLLGTGPFRVDADVSEAEVARIGKVTGLKIYEGRAEADGVVGQRAQIVIIPGNVMVGTLLGREVAREQLPGVRELGCEPTYRFVPGVLRVQCTGKEVPKAFLP